MRVLVTSSRNPFALDIIRKLGSLGHTVVASDTYEGALGNHSRYLTAHAVTASPRSATDAFIADVAAIVERHGIELIVPSFEEAFHLAARVDDLPAGVRLFTGSFEQLARLHDKVSFQRIAAAAGVPVPDTVVATDAKTLQAAIAGFPSYFARAAFSRGGVALLTNTGPLSGAMRVEDCHPTPDQPWLVQPFVAGPMVCTFSTIVEGRVLAHCTYRAPRQWAHSTGISFLGVDSTQTLEDTRRFIAELDPHYTGQLSFDYVDHEGTLTAIECNPRPTNGVILLGAEEYADALAGTAAQAAVVPEGTQREVRLAAVLEAFTEPLRQLPHSLHSIATIADVGAGWHDDLAMLWSPASLVHGMRMDHGLRRQVLAALSDDIVWNGEPIAGMRASDAQALEEIHAGRR